MKTHLYLLGMLSTFALVRCEGNPEWKAKFEECNKEFDLPEESLKTPNFEDPKIRCFSACFLKKDDRLAEGKLSIDKEVDAYLKYVDKEKHDDSYQDKITECVNKANEEKDDCDVGGTMLKCVFDKFGTFEDKKE